MQENSCPAKILPSSHPDLVICFKHSLYLLVTGAIPLLLKKKEGTPASTNDQFTQPDLSKCAGRQTVGRQ